MCSSETSEKSGAEKSGTELLEVAKKPPEKAQIHLPEREQQPDKPEEPTAPQIPAVDALALTIPLPADSEDGESGVFSI